MQLFVKTPAGPSITLDVHGRMTIGRVKSLIATGFGHHNAAPKDYRLMYGCRQLDDNFVISNYNIPNESTLVLVLRIRGGADASLDSGLHLGRLGEAGVEEADDGDDEAERTLQYFIAEGIANPNLGVSDELELSSHPSWDGP
eukprot:10884578-Heterocapsa_arctica.AAC.1